MLSKQLLFSVLKTAPLRWNANWKQQNCLGIESFANLSAVLPETERVSKVKYMHVLSNYSKIVRFLCVKD